MSNLPASLPEKTMVLPSGLQLGAYGCSMSPMSMIRRTPPLRTSIRRRLRAFSRLAKMARVLPSGEKDMSRPKLRPRSSSWATRYW